MRGAEVGEPFSWKVERDGEWLRVALRGEIDENADFSELRIVLRGNVELSLEGITRINSCGVREWVNFVRDLPGVTELTFTHCSPAIVTQLNMIYNFRGAAKVRSFYAPYVCDACGHEDEKLLDVQNQFPSGPGKVPEYACEQCGAAMEFDDLPERYLSFLNET